MSSPADALSERTTSPEDPAAPPVAPVLPDRDDALPVTVIERRGGWRFLDLRELWRFRELLFFLGWRDVKVRYKQTVLGAAWAVLQPLATMVVFSVFLGRVGGISTGDIPYPLFVFAGLLPWTFFSNAVITASQSVVANQNLVTKVYFPRVIIPLSAAGAALVDFFIAFAMMLALMVWHRTAPGPSVVLLPFILALLVVAALGVGILLSALTVAYRDFRHVVPFGVQIWMFATPTIYLNAADVVGPRGQLVMPLNPAYGLIFNFRQAMLGGPIDGYALTVSGLSAVALFTLGCLYFRRIERTFADII